MIEKFILHTSWFGDGDEAGAVCANEIRRVKSFTFLNANEMTFFDFFSKNGIKLSIVNDMVGDMHMICVHPQYPVIKFSPF